MDKDCKHIKHQRLCHEAVVLNAVTLYEGHFVPGPLTGKSWMPKLYKKMHNKRNTK